MDKELDMTEWLSMYVATKSSHATTKESCMPQQRLKILCATTKTRHSQRNKQVTINKYFKIKVFLFLSLFIVCLPIMRSLSSENWFAFFNSVFQVLNGAWHKQVLHKQVLKE